ncbi:hypothetical protein [Sinanaerobacter chloroacetimidivorans]|jgi:hypothetical protein|uniref:Uncharacterized protein n=1 Tax=Sinanaerobacter chloroacetimidivorans TaxID=2818044 RepID=A0A8J7W2H0_9FIRM|nr:hypothetical protein [Sinanaerobacter chloroacetimidivorans]MBR0599687.1 hypothetical protein [Sinanaerobacter chloroacetimidivorans]
MFIKDSNSIHEERKAIYNPIEGKWEKPITYDSEGNIKVETTSIPLDIKADQMIHKIARISDMEHQTAQLKTQAAQFKLQGEKLFSKVKTFLEDQQFHDSSVMDGERLTDRRE